MTSIVSHNDDLHYDHYHWWQALRNANCDKPLLHVCSLLLGILLSQGKGYVIAESC